ncbi:MAG: hypothetical protein Q7S79_02425 [bacterium]|nr:hypothetical protein [bacterium]
MSTNKLLVSIAIVLTILVASMGGYYLYSAGFFSNLKFGSKEVEKVSENLTPTPTKVVKFADVVKLKKLPEGMTRLDCPKIVYLSLGAAPADCLEANPQTTALMLFAESSNFYYEHQLKTGATISKKDFKVSGKDAIEIQKTYKFKGQDVNYTMAVIKVNEEVYVYVAVNDGKYKAQYEEILNNLQFF